MDHKGWVYIALALLTSDYEIVLMSESDYKAMGAA